MDKRKANRIATVISVIMLVLAIVAIYFLVTTVPVTAADLEEVCLLFILSAFVIPHTLQFLLFRPIVAFALYRMEAGKDNATYWLLNCLEGNLYLNRWVWVRGKYKQRLLDRMEKIYLRQLEGGEKLEPLRFWMCIHLRSLGRDVPDSAIS